MNFLSTVLGLLFGVLGFALAGALLVLLVLGGFWLLSQVVKLIGV